MTGYAGDLTPQEAWSLLESDPSAILIDVRTQAEWSYVGFVDLSSINKSPLFIEWVTFPEGRINSEFGSQVEGTNIDKDTPVLFLCRSGVRSIAAAQEVTGHGFTKCFNVLEGFEGDPDGARHRGTVGGWKVRGLPWQQQ
jgi:rhodanese-related sulfurtransferase